MQETKDVQDFKEIEILTQDTNQEADEKFTEISSGKRERRNNTAENWTAAKRNQESWKRNTYNKTGPKIENKQEKQNKNARVGEWEELCQIIIDKENYKVLKSLPSDVNLTGPEVKSVPCPTVVEYENIF